MLALIRRNAWFLATLWAVAVLMLTLMPGNDVPAWPWAEAVHLDKFVHAILFAVQSLLLGIALGSMGAWRSRISPVAVAALVAIVYGGVIELLQEGMDAGRHGDVLDLLADSVGALIGYGLLRRRGR